MDILKHKFYRVELRKDLSSTFVVSLFVDYQVLPEKFKEYLKAGYQVSIICEVIIEFGIHDDEEDFTIPDVIKISSNDE